MTEGQFLHYDGPVTVDGIKYPTARLREHREQSGLRSWDGAAWIAASRTPEGYKPSLSGNEPIPVELPDGRHGNALVTNVGFDGAYFKLELTGTGPAPGHTGDAQ
ncbi:hypothetical protein AB0G67_40685 [Streptomyces sp. NPDC021056]|uniref:hypothetical protein n=1 Tax=Streptomyces sp. NPDC021056 TaxID=3155012 RepID=UPI0033C4347B